MIRRLLKRRTALSLLLALPVFAYGAPQTGSTGPANQAPAPAQPATLPSPPPGAAAAVDSNGYIVESPDVLHIEVWHQPDFTGMYSVHPDGKITMPLIGDIQAGGKTPATIEKTIKEALAKYMNQPLVTVTVQEVLSKKYYMDGEINRPGEYPLVSKTTILEAISKAGGLAAFANAKKIYVLRGDKRIMFNYKEVIHGKNLAQNIDLKPDDHVVVP
jgi:polysaccharide export outer membrane protein